MLGKVTLAVTTSISDAQDTSFKRSPINRLYQQHVSEGGCGHCPTVMPKTARNRSAAQFFAVARRVRGITTHAVAKSAMRDVNTTRAACGS